MLFEDVNHKLKNFLHLVSFADTFSNPAPPRVSRII
jgi:hypothetical protein